MVISTHKVLANLYRKYPEILDNVNIKTKAL